VPEPCHPLRRRCLKEDPGTSQLHVPAPALGEGGRAGPPDDRVKPRSVGRSVCLSAPLELAVSPCHTCDCVSLKFTGVALQLRSDCTPVETNTAVQGSWELIATSFKECFYYALEPICQSIEVITTKGLLIELNEPSKQIKIMKHFMLPNRQTAVPPNSHSGRMAGLGSRRRGKGMFGNSTG